MEDLGEGPDETYSHPEQIFDSHFVTGSLRKRKWRCRRPGVLDMWVHDVTELLKERNGVKLTTSDPKRRMGECDKQ
jgi:hypothetical protein